MNSGIFTGQVAGNLWVRQGEANKG